MPKKKKAGKNSKNKGDNVEKRKLVEADINGQVYGFVETALGSRFFSVNCMDNIVRRCRVRSKRLRIKKGDCLIIALRDFDDGNADIIYRYDSDEVRQLQKMDLIPKSEVIGLTNDETQPQDDGDCFVFEDI
jgi:translation initiation factor 1A